MVITPPTPVCTGLYKESGFSSLEPKIIMNKSSLTQRKLIDSLVICIAWLGAAAIVLVFLFAHTSQAALAPKKASLTGRQALERAAKAWKEIYDYQTLLYQTERHPNGDVKEFWARVRMVRPTEEKKELEPAFLLEMFDKPVTWITQVPQDATPVKTYFADASQNFYTINPEANTITIEKLTENTSPLPEFMYLAGFLDFDIETFKEKAYIDPVALEENIEGVETYKIQVKPRKEIQDVDPPRYLWIERKTSLPRQFAVDADIKVNVVFSETKTNQNLNSIDLIPEVREDAVRDDRTK